MKRLLRLFLINYLSLWLAAKIIPGIEFLGGIKTIILATLSLTIINQFVKPLIKLLLLPINFLTLGAFRWLINVLALYLVTLVVPQFEIVSFVYPGTDYQGFIVPMMEISVFWVYVLTSFVISIFSTFFAWVAKK